jgi:hypothetical protein
MKTVSCLPFPVNIIADLPGAAPAELSFGCGDSEEPDVLSLKNKPLSFAAGLIQSEKPLPLFVTSRGHQLTRKSGFGGTPSPFARNIK